MTDGLQAPHEYPTQPPIPPQYPTQPPAVEWHSPQAASPPPKGKSSKVVLGIGIGCALLLCACVSVVVLVSALSTCSAKAEPWTLTNDEQRVMREFGPPEAFTVAFASDLTTVTAKGKEPPLRRLESWQYPSLGSEFSFRDGAFVSRKAIEVPKLALKTPALRPDAFRQGMTPGQVSKIVDAKPDKTAAVFPKVFKGLEVQSYRGQVVAGYQDGKLVSVQVSPVAVKGAAK